MPTRRARSGNYVVYRTGANKLAEAALLPVYLARRRRKVDAADTDADEDNEEGEVLEADAESQKRRKTEDAVAAMNVAEDVRMESDSGAFLVDPCNGEDPEDGKEDYDEYIVESDDAHYEERLEDEEDNNNEDNDPAPAEAVSGDGSSLHLPCNDFQDFDIINLIIQEIAKKFILLQMNPLNLQAPDILSVGSRLTKLEAHTAIISTFDKFALKNETREGFLSLPKLLHPEGSLPKDTKHLLSYKEGLLLMLRSSLRRPSQRC